MIVADLEAAASEAATRIAATLTVAVRERDQAFWATTGGSIAAPMYRHLAADPLREQVPWDKVHVWWGDDRFVPRDHPLSNVKPFDDIMLAIAWTQGGQVAQGQSGQALPVGIPLDQLHPFPTTKAIGAGHDAAWCAAELARDLAGASLERSEGWPMFDLIVIGVGADGHVFSVFPGSPAFDSTALALAIPAPTHIEPHIERVTLNPRVLAAARQVILVAAGVEKAPVLQEALDAEADPRRLPVHLARTANAVWILDSAAAGELDAGRDVATTSAPPASPG